MRLVLFTHSLVSDWNHGNAHFLRGVLREITARGHDTIAWEPADGWSRSNLLEEEGDAAVTRFERQFPELTVRTYGAEPDLDELLDGADVVLVHEWTDPALIAQIGRRRLAGGSFTLLFHDTHHRALSAAAEIDALELEGYDAVLAFGEVLADLYRQRGWGRRVFTWHEAADLRLFRPQSGTHRSQDLAWIGNWGDGERGEELTEFLVEPAARLGLSGSAFGVRYPEEALQQLAAAGLRYYGWLPNADVPQAFARHRVTVHIPRRPYVRDLPGIPTIRVFEALACAIPLVCAPWDDVEGLFRPGEDFLLARDGDEMTAQLRRVLSDPELSAELRRNGLETVRARHGCTHRVDELFDILATFGHRELAQ